MTENVKDGDVGDGVGKENAVVEGRVAFVVGAATVGGRSVDGLEGAENVIAGGSTCLGGPV